MKTDGNSIAYTETAVCILTTQCGNLPLLYTETAILHPVYTDGVSFLYTETAIHCSVYTDGVYVLYTAGSCPINTGSRVRAWRSHV